MSDCPRSRQRSVRIVLAVAIAAGAWVGAATRPWRTWPSARVIDTGFDVARGRAYQVLVSVHGRRTPMRVRLSVDGARVSIDGPSSADLGSDERSVAFRVVARDGAPTVSLGWPSTARSEVVARVR